MDFQTRIPRLGASSFALEIVERLTSTLGRFSFDVEPCVFAASNKIVHVCTKLVQHRKQWYSASAVLDARSTF